MTTHSLRWDSDEIFLSIKRLVSSHLRVSYTSHSFRYISCTNFWYLKEIYICMKQLNNIDFHNTPKLYCIYRVISYRFTITFQCNKLDIYKICQTFLFCDEHCFIRDEILLHDNNFVNLVRYSLQLLHDNLLKVPIRMCLIFPRNSFCHDSDVYTDLLWYISVKTFLR